MISVFAIMHTKPGKKQQTLEIARNNLANVRAEPGCREYRLVEDAQGAGAVQVPLGENAFAFIEVWDSLAALGKHLATPHMKAYNDNVQDLITDKTIHILQSSDN